MNGIARAVGMALALVASMPAAAATAPARPVFAQDSLNIYRRYPAELHQRMVHFYADVLGLTALHPIQLTAQQQIILFRLGSGQIKLAAGLKPGRAYHPDGIDAATGIRLFALPVADEAAIAARFVANGLPAPVFREAGDGRRAALVTDPGGFTLELVHGADAGPGAEVGIAVTDLARARAFYRDFAGLEPLPPRRDAVLGHRLERYRNGQTTLALWQAPRGAPADTGSAGIQYVITNLDAVNAAAQRAHVTVEEPLSTVAGFPVRTLWLNDPDGATNYFYEREGAAR